MGFYDDYDSEMGWDYRDESLDDDLEVVTDSEEDDLGSDWGVEKEEREKEEEELKSPSEDGGLLEYLMRKHMVEQPSEREMMESEDDNDGESSVAEDELINRLASDQFLSSHSMWTPSPSPPTRSSPKPNPKPLSVSVPVSSPPPPMPTARLSSPPPPMPKSTSAASSSTAASTSIPTAVNALNHVPLTGLFAVNKPTGITSTTILDHLQHICKRNQTHPLVKGVLAVDKSKRAVKRGLVKIGHGGTLDPLARGIVVVGMGTGCKKLNNMSGSSKVYIAEARLGVSSSTLDSTGSLVDQKPTNHITKALLLDALQAFKGEISQTPPLYSALNMDGKRLYDYAREGIPLPREIPSRKVQIYDLELLSYPDDGITAPDPRLRAFGFQVDSNADATDIGDSDNINSKSTTELSDLKKDTQDSSTFRPKKLADPITTPVPPPNPATDKYFHIRVHCSSGTYIRTLIADIATHLGTVGLMTDLLRVEQSGYRLDGPATMEMKECEDLEAVQRAIDAGNIIWEERSAKASQLEKEE
ncbi:hypothetical protein EC991_003795 [Linnemannia zychae]|nr:hypothetical protein EC991_003795 [Linnemannia zychae]